MNLKKNKSVLLAIGLAILSLQSWSNSCRNFFQQYGGRLESVFMLDPEYVAHLRPEKAVELSKVWQPADLFEKAKHITLLGDGQMSIQGMIVATRFPNAKVISGDLNSVAFEGPKNLEVRLIDHLKPLPIESSSQDIVILRRGLCACHGDCCAGFKPISQEANNFFAEVVRITASGGQGFLQGSNHLQDVHWKAFEGYLQAQQKIYPNLKWELFQHVGLNEVSGIHFWKDVLN